MTGPSPVICHGYSNGGKTKLNYRLSSFEWFLQIRVYLGCVPYAFLLQYLFGNDRSASTNDDAVARGLLHLRQHLAGVVLDSGPIPMNLKAVSLLFMFIPSKPTIFAHLSNVAICTQIYLSFHFSQMRSLFPFKYEYFVVFELSYEQLIWLLTIRIHVDT